MDTILKAVTVDRSRAATPQIEEQVRELILDGKLEPGMKLPSTKALAELWGNVWAWSFGVPGPTDGFVDVETTIGPEGAENVFPPDTVVLPVLHSRVYDEGDGVFYIEKLVVEDISGE